jgi:hypothetical protein
MGEDKCPCCAAQRSGPPPEAVPARAQYGPWVLATAAELTCAHYLPVGRAMAAAQIDRRLTASSSISCARVASPGNRNM